MAVVPSECPLCDAPPCFRYAITRALERAPSDYTPTNWRGFSDYFMIRLTPYIPTPEDLVTYWVDEHPNKHAHTINKAMEFANNREHKLLQDKLSYLVASK